MNIKTKRVYEKPASGDGMRILIDRLWPRGLSKGTAQIDKWLKDTAPSDSLRRWFGHDPTKWKEFRKRYFAELDGKSDIWRGLLECAQRDVITLLYAAKDSEHNNAIALKQFLESRKCSVGS